MTRPDQARLARLACERKATEVNSANRAQLHRLNAIAASAFFFGTLLTLLWIVSSFVGFNGPIHDYFLRLMAALGRSLRPMGIGLSAGIIARTVSDYVGSAAEELAVEMHSAALQLENYLLLNQSDQKDRGKPNTCSAT